MRINLPLTTLILILLPTFASVANACTCGGAKPCELYAYASVVFVGRVIKTEDDVARLTVEEAFLGVEGPEIEVRGQGTNCDYNFKDGERYLVYAERNSGVVRTSICSGTALVSESKEALDYLRREKQSSGSTVSGDINRVLDPGTATIPPKLKPIANAEIILDDGKRRFQSRSDAAGNFVLQGVPRGRYRIHTNPVTNSSSLDRYGAKPRQVWKLEVPGHGCVQTWFLAMPRVGN
ncbi:MAG TPA: hypothetical protein VFT02_10570 [Pyrinomonadaceae bacterium]|nr:hypothetical protein [Pyrinomonadaceae bacterium]